MNVGDFVFDLATPADDAAIRRLLADNPVPGDVTLTYRREPNYFAGSPVMGDTQILVARHRPTGRLAALATRSIRMHFVNGEPEAVGYVGQLRIDHAFRGRWLVPLGFRYFHGLHQDGRVRGYYTTIIQGNAEAEGVLVAKARRHFPAYRPIGTLVTLAILLHKRRLPRSYDDLVLSSAKQDELDEIVAFLQEEGRRKQFFPHYRRSDFESTATRDFHVEDFLVARRSGRLVGLLGLWDQGGFKQTTVTGLSRRMQRLRPFYNAAARLGGAPPMATVGTSLNTVYAAFICVAEDEPAVFATLLDGAFRLAAGRGHAFLTVGLSPADPLYAVAKRFFHIPYVSTIYTVCWRGDEAFHDRLDGRPPYLELAAL